ncbi:MAG: erythromycin esterase family protein [Pseudomonadota bacterium]
MSLSLQDLTPTGEPFGWYLQADAEKLEQQVLADPATGLPRWVLRNAGPSPAIAYTRSDGASVCHRRLRIAAEARTEDSGSVSGVVRIDGSPNFGAPVPLSREWVEARHEVEGIPCVAPNALVGFAVRGHVELRRLHILLDGRPEVMPSLSPVRWADLAVLRRVAASPAEPARTPRLAAVLGRRVLALGENGDGAADVFLAKFDLIRHLASTGRMRMLVLDVPAVAAERVDRYVRGSADDREAVVDALTYPAFQSAQMLQIIDWLRTTNGERPQAIGIAGFDVRQPRWALRALERASIRIDAVLEPWQRGEVARALARIEALAPRTAGDPALARYLRLARRGLLVGRPDLSGRSRGAYMADEVLRLARAQTGQLVLWADNSHVARHAGRLGGELAQALGEDYAVIGFTFAEGAYAAHGPDSPYPVQTPYPGTHEHLLADTGLERFILGLADVPEAHPLRERRGLRVLGALPQPFDQFLPVTLESQFDAIGFVRRTAAAQRLREEPVD